MWILQCPRYIKKDHGCITTFVNWFQFVQASSSYLNSSFYFGFSTAGGMRGLGPQANVKNCQIRHHQICFFFKPKVHQNPFSPDSFFQAQNAPKSVFTFSPPGELTTLPQIPQSCCGGSLDAPGVSNSSPTAPRFSGPLNTNSWQRQCSVRSYTIIITKNMIRPRDRSVCHNLFVHES